MASSGAQDVLLLLESQLSLGFIEVKPHVVGVLVRYGYIELTGLGNVPVYLLGHHPALSSKSVLGPSRPVVVNADIDYPGLLSKFARGCDVVIGLTLLDVPLREAPMALRVL